MIVVNRTRLTGDAPLALAAFLGGQFFIEEMKELRVLLPRLGIGGVMR